MPKIQDKVWVTKDGREIPVEQMDEEHLQLAFNHCTTREFTMSKEIFKLYGRINTQVRLKKMLLEEANKKGITLQYPDEKFPSTRWGDYFANERKTIAMESLPTQELHPEVSS